FGPGGWAVASLLCGRDKILHETLKPRHRKRRGWHSNGTKEGLPMPCQLVTQQTERYFRVLGTKTHDCFCCLCFVALELENRQDANSPAWTAPDDGPRRGVADKVTRNKPP